MSWQDLETGAPRMAARGRELIMRTGTGSGMLGTVGATTPPRIHPVTVVFVEGRLLLFGIDGSLKTRELLDDGRYAFHAHLDPVVPEELLLRGHARVVTDEALRGRALAVWPFDAAVGYTLFELEVEHALLGVRASASEWPPRYTSWHARARPDATTDG
jgi:hypothetical protein